MRIFYNQKEMLFCERYWANVLHKNRNNFSAIEKVSTNFDLTDANNYLLNCYEGYFLQKLEKSVGMKLNQFIAKSDLEFKFLKPTDFPITVWRGVAKPSNKADSIQKALFEKALKTQNGDIIYMPEYAYASMDKDYADSFMHKNGILYQIEVPKGAKISGMYTCTFPRYSKFECTETEEIAKGKLIKLIYIKNEK